MAAPAFYCQALLLAIVLSINYKAIAEPYVPQLFDLEQQIPFECAVDEHCYSVDDLIPRVLDSNLLSLQKIYVLLQAKQAVKARFANFLPQLKIGSWPDKKGLTIEIPMPFVGFLSPTKWFNYSSSKYLYQAEEESIKSLLADLVLSTMDIYYDIQMQLWSMRVMGFYRDEADRLIAFLEEEIANNTGRASLHDVAFIKNIRARLEYDYSFMDGLSSSLPFMATAIGLPPDVDWIKLKLEPCHIETDEKRPLKYLDIWARAIDRSTEIKSFQYLIKSAKRDKKAVVTSVFDLFDGINLGFYYGPEIKIARSNVRVIELESKRAEMKLSNDIQFSLNYYTESTHSMPWLWRGIKELPYLQQSLKDNIADNTEPFKLQLAIQYFDMAENQALRYVHAYFVYRMAKASLDRYRWQGKYYRMVNRFADEKLPQYLKLFKKGNKRLKKHHRQKNTVR